jgi:hypothetical protein
MYKNIPVNMPTAMAIGSSANIVKTARSYFEPLGLNAPTWAMVCLRYYDRSRFRSDALAAFLLSLQIFPFAIAIAVAIGVHPLYGISCAAVAGPERLIFLVTRLLRNSR